MLRATLKSLLSRKLRLVLSGLAVVLGVMFVSGSFVLTDTLDRSFTSLFSSIYSGVDVSVTAESKANAPSILPADTVAKVESVDGVARADGQVNGSARPIGKNGKVLTTAGAPRLGTGWVEGDDQIELREGTGPKSDDQVAIGAFLATTGGFKVGDQIELITLEPKKKFTVSGIYGYPGGRDSLGGELITSFTEPVAQQLLLGQKDVFSDIRVTASTGVSQEQLRDRIGTALGDGYQVRTGTQLADEQADQIAEGLKFFNYVLLAFAGIALFVGIFIILNTFSIIVAQRTRELALLRSMGASRGQVMTSVVVEAFVIGLIASVVGLAAGVGVGALLANLFATFGGGSLQLAGIGLPLSAVISSFAVGIVVTVVAAILPALRASRIAPVAAMREAATPDRPLTRLTVAGTAILALGGAGLAFGFAQETLWLIFAGVLTAFVGVALLTPLVSRPMVSLIGRLLSWSMPGLLGRRNSARNPRRTAITAAALMVGIALITGVSVVLTSATASITKLADTQIKSDLIVSGEFGADGAGATFTPATLEKIKQQQGVGSVVGWYADAAMIGDQQQFVAAVNDVGAMRDQFGITARQGTLAPLRDDQLGISEEYATTHGLSTGSTLTLQLARGEPRTYSVAFIWNSTPILQGIVLPDSAGANFRVPQLSNAYVQVAPGASAGDVQKRIEPLFADNPEISVQDRSAFVRQQTSQLDTVLVMIQILLALAILIAVLGVINTLALSVIERTRELGLLRAIGMRRGQVMRMITVESVVISVFGAVLGLVVGAALGIASVEALKEQGITDLAFPWAQMAQYLVVAAVVGVVAAILPAIRAARLNVLDAIAYE